MTEQATVLVLVDGDSNRAQVREQLDGAFDVVVGADDGGLPSFDLCLVDRTELARHHEVIRDRKQEAEPVFLPCLLLEDGQNHASDGLTVVDGIEPLSADGGDLSARVSRLVDRRARTGAEPVREQGELEYREAFTEAAIEALPDLFYVFDSSGSLRQWNRRAPEITGYDDAELEAMHTLDFLPEEHHERVGAEIMTVLEEGEPRTIEVPLVTRADEELPYEFRVAPVYGPDGDLIGGVGIGRDITDRKMRQELARQNERLEKFASIVSHDLRNPIAVTNGYLELAAKNEDSQYVEAAQDSIERMETLIDDLLALARQGNVVDDPERVSLDAVVTRAWQVVESDAATLEADCETAVLADEGRLQQLFENLFRNAVEHGGDDVTVTVGETNRGFYVADDGPGIDPDERDDVFEYGYTTSDAGTGFGLAIVKEIADAHGWAASVTESESGGARFEFEDVDHPVADD